MEGEHAHLLDQVQLAGAIEVEDGRERARMSVKEELHAGEIIVVAQLHERVVGCATSQLTEACVWHACECPPHDLVSRAADVEDDPTTGSLASFDRQRVGSELVRQTE